MSARPLDVLDRIPAAQWTPEEAYLHCRSLFDTVCKNFPDLMEPYMVLLGELPPDAGQRQEIQIMQRGLRETFRRRYPQVLTNV